MARQIERRIVNRAQTNKKILVLYHGGCNDGFGGAWAAWKKFGNRAEYIAMNRNNPLAVPVGKEEIYFIDYLLSASEIKEYIEKNKRVTAIDHHITMKDAAELTHAPSFSLDNSGAVLAWKYFHGNKKVPMLLKYIEDRDLWRFEMPKAKEILAGTNFSDERVYTFKGFDILVKNFEKASFRSKCIKDGKIVRSVFDGIIKNIATHADKVKFEGRNCWVVNSPHMFASEVGNLLAHKDKQIGMAIIWYAEGGVIKVSLRSRGFDVSKLAEKYGGGGHKRAAGFIIKDFKVIPWKVINKK